MGFGEILYPKRGQEHDRELGSSATYIITG